MGPDPNLGGGEPVDAFMEGTPNACGYLLASAGRKHSDFVDPLLSAGATNETPTAIGRVIRKARNLPERPHGFRASLAISRAVALCQIGLPSNPMSAFVEKASHQDCHILP